MKIWIKGSECWEVYDLLASDCAPPNSRWGLMSTVVLVAVDEEKDSRISNEKLNFEPPTQVGGLTNRTLLPTPVSNSNRMR